MRERLISSIAALGLTGASAFAADMAVKSAPPAPAPVYNWTGWYVGMNAGASFGNVNTDFNAPAAVTLNIGQGPGTSPVGAGGSNREYPGGFIGGGQVGYNWQYSPLIVVGLEADIQGALEKDSNTPTSNFFGFISAPGIVIGPGTVASTALNYQTQIDWFGTVRGRIGYLWGNGDVLTYVTGGLAYGEVKINGTSTVTQLAIFPNSSVIQGFGHSHVNTGWVVGFGTEGKLLIPGWTYKIESLYMDLGTLDAAGAGGSVSTSSGGAPVTLTAGPVTTHTHFTDGILRGGLNYKFY